ncbi:TPTE2, partial [Symbiodinium pilosum]
CSSTGIRCRRWSASSRLFTLRDTSSSMRALRSRTTRQHSGRGSWRGSMC